MSAADQARAEMARREAILRQFELDNIEDHGLMRWRNGREWMEGFMAIADQGLIWIGTTGSGCDLAPVKGWVGLLYDRIVGYRGFSKIATADLFLSMDNGERLRLNGGKTFVFECCRALGAKGIPSPRRP